MSSVSSIKQPNLLDEPEDDTEAEEGTGRGRTIDPELRVMGAMLRLLRDLPDRARPRVVLWLASRYEEEQKQ